MQDCDQVKFARLEVDPSTTDDRVARAQVLAREIDGLLTPTRVATANEVARESSAHATQSPELSLPATEFASPGAPAAGAPAASAQAPTIRQPAPESPAAPRSVNLGGGFTRTEDGQLIAGGR